MVKFIDATDSGRAVIIIGIDPAIANGKKRPGGGPEPDAPAKEDQAHGADPTADGADREGEKDGTENPPGRKG
jgi:hypothetical protein